MTELNLDFCILLPKDIPGLGALAFLREPVEVRNGRKTSSRRSQLVKYWGADSVRMPVKTSP